jgi:hypothetical protein
VAVTGDGGEEKIVAIGVGTEAACDLVKPRLPCRCAP